jgi:hypothetical protein
MLGDRAKDRSTPNCYVPAPTRNVRFTSTRDIQSPATNVRNPPQPYKASIDWHTCVVS